MDKEQFKQKPRSSLSIQSQIDRSHHKFNLGPESHQPHRKIRYSEFEKDSNLLDVYASGMGNGPLKEKLHKMLKNNHLETFYNKRLKIKRESSLGPDKLEPLIGIPPLHP